MSVYTVPALNAVDFALTSFTPEVLPSNISVLSAYTVPALNAVNFALTSYTPPTYPTIDFELFDSPEPPEPSASLKNRMLMGMGL